MLSALLIDLDGTLLNTAPDLTAAANAVRQDLGLEPLPQALISSFVGLGVDSFITRAVAGDKNGVLAEAQFTQAKALYQKHYDAINGQFSEPYAGVMAALDAFKNLGLKLACVTNKSRRFTLPLLAMKGLAPYFQAVVAGDDLPTRKPQPEMLYTAAAQLGVDIQHCVMIGDSIHDYEAAHAAGIPALILPYGYNEAGFGSMDSAILIKDFTAALAWVKAKRGAP